MTSSLPYNQDRVGIVMVFIYKAFCISVNVLGLTPYIKIIIPSYLRGQRCIYFVIFGNISFVRNVRSSINKLYVFFKTQKLRTNNTFPFTKKYIEIINIYKKLLLL